MSLLEPQFLLPLLSLAILLPGNREAFTKFSRTDSQRLTEAPMLAQIFPTTVVEPTKE